MGRNNVNFSPSAIAALTSHNWPGNVRELQNRIRRALGSSMENILTSSDLGLGEGDDEANEHSKLLTLKEAREEAEKKVIQQALALAAGNISHAAKLLATSRPTLHDLLKKHDLQVKQ